MVGLFNGLFDFDHDGKLDSFEQAAEFSAFESMMDEDERREALEDAGLDEDDEDF